MCPFSKGFHHGEAQASFDSGVDERGRKEFACFREGKAVRNSNREEVAPNAGRGFAKSHEARNSLPVD
jgi:hypothetical protein